MNHLKATQDRSPPADSLSLHSDPCCCGSKMCHNQSKRLQSDNGTLLQIIMSRLLKQVYSQNIYVEFRFESSLRKYDKKPTKKIKCEVECKHCASHHRRVEHSPSRERNLLESRSRLKKFLDNSLEKPSEKSVISECKTIRLSKQKAPLTDKELNLLEMNVYRSLMEDISKEENPVLQKSQEDNSSSMEDEVFFNEFGHSPEKEVNRDIVNSDFDKIEIPLKYEAKVENIASLQAEDLDIKEQIIFQQEKQMENQFIVEEKQKNDEGSLQQLKDQEQEQEIKEEEEPKQIQQPFQQQAMPQDLEQIISQEVFPIEQEIGLNVCLSKQSLQEVPIPELAEDGLQIPCSPLPLRRETSEDCDSLVSQDVQEALEDRLAPRMISPQIIEERFMGESMMDKCLAFQGGRIYVDTSGQNFYISVRVFNKLRRRYSDIEQLTNVLIQQRPCLQSKKSQIRHELSEYLSTFL